MTSATKLHHRTCHLCEAACGIVISLDADDQITAILAARYDSLPPEIAAVARLSDATVLTRVDAPDARDAVRMAYGDAGLIELSFAMNGAALLPGIKRAMGYAVACDLDVARGVSTDG